MKIALAVVMACLINALPAFAETIYPAPCPSTTAEDITQVGYNFSGYYNSDNLFLQAVAPKHKPAGVSLCISHDGINYDCTVSGAKFIHINTKGEDSYFSIPSHEIVDVVLKDQKLTCTMK